MEKMIVDLTYEEFKDYPKFDGLYKLCYIDNIEEEIYEYDEESQKIINSVEFSWHNESKAFDGVSPRLHMTSQPNPFYKKRQYEYFAYFTSCSINDQWGDDWDDSPYQDNAGEPYDDIHDNSIFESISKYTVSYQNDYDVLRVRFVIKSYFCKFALDFANLSVIDINKGAAAWIFEPGNSNQLKSIAIYGGCTAEEFIKNIDIIATYYPGWIDEDDEDD